MRLPLQAAARLDAIEVPVDVDLEQRTRVIRRPATGLAIDCLEAQRAQVERFNEAIDHPHWVVFVDIVFKPIGEQKPLRTINAIHESLHAEQPLTGAQIMPVKVGFSHSLGQKRT